MKKLLALLLLVTSFVLVACESEPKEKEDDKVIECTSDEVLVGDECQAKEVEMTLEERILGAKEALDFDSYEVFADLDLPAKGLNDVNVTWESLDEAKITSDGIVTRPRIGRDNVSVTMVATLEYEGTEVRKNFNLIILARGTAGVNDIIQDKEEINIGDLSNVTAKLSLPSKGANGSVIVWTSSNNQIVDSGGYVNQPGFIEGDKNVTLTATLTLGEFTETITYELTIKAEDENFVTSSSLYDFTSLATEYTVPSSQLELFFVSDENLPYVDIQSFINTLAGAIQSDELIVVANGDQLSVTYEIVDEDDPEITYSYGMNYDFTQNTVTINDFSFFSGFSEETETDFGSGLETVDYVYTDAEEVTIDFDFYHFDLIVHNDKYLIPYHVANLFYSGGMYDTYYNGEKIYGVDTYQLMDDDSVPETIASSSFNSEVMPDDIRQASYDFLAFVFDYFYGLKDEQEVETYYDELQIFKSTFMKFDDKRMYESVSRFIYSRDDLHTSHMFAGYYENGYSVQTTLADLGPRTNEYYAASGDLSAACATKSGHRVIDSGKTAIIFIGGFEAETPAEFGASIDAIKALGTVENIVVDLTCNGGGILGSAFQILGYMTDLPVAIHSKETTDLSTESWYMSTANEAVDVNWYILTSPVTFSAANLMTSVAKDMGIATIIGQQSSGGACSIAAILTPDGSGILISSTGMLTDDQYNSIEFGIPVDYEMLNVNSDSELLGIVNGN